MNAKRYRKGLTCGTFDLCHAGHVLMFEECKELCDHLIVGVQVDPTVDRPFEKAAPIQSIAERTIVLTAIKFIDELFVYKTDNDLMSLLAVNAFRIDVRFVGPEYRAMAERAAGLSFVHHINSRSHNFSSTNIRSRVYDAECARRDTGIFLTDLSDNEILIISS